MENPSRTADRRSRPRDFSGYAPPRPHPLSRVAPTGPAGFREAGRSIGRLVAGLPRRVDAALVAFSFLLPAMRRPVLAPIAIDDSSAKFRRSRVIRRR